jgi:hypothetical protein
MYKKKIVVVGNCQARPIAKLLGLMSDEIEITKIAIVHLLKPEDESEYNSFFEDADYIITQLVASNYPCEFVRTAKLKLEYEEKVTTIVNLYFSGNHPDWIYFRGEDRQPILGPLKEYHNLTILKCWYLGLSVSDAENFLLSVPYNQYEFGFESDKSFNKLVAKENDVDIKISDYIKSNELLFWTFNHPKNKLLLEYASRIYNTIFKDHPDQVTVEKESLGQVVLPPNIISYKKTISVDLKNPSLVIDSTENLITKFYNFYSENKLSIRKYVVGLLFPDKTTNKNNVFISFSGLRDTALPIASNIFSKSILINVDNNFLHLADVQFQIDGVWHDIRSNIIEDITLSSILKDEDKFSIDSLKQSKSRFFSTRKEKKAFISIVFKQLVFINNIKIINRPEYTLWNRTESLQIISKNNDFSTVFDNKNSQSLKLMINTILDNLEKKKNLSFLQSEFLMLRLYIRPITILTNKDCEENIVQICNKLLKILLGEGAKKYTSIIYELEEFIVLLGNLSFLRNHLATTTILISYLIINNKLKDAFNIYKNVCINWVVADTDTLKKAVELIAKLQYGHSLVPATHTFSRPIRDWPRDLVFNTIDTILTSTKIDGVECGFICYGTLLGLYRDKDFIEHDDDVDLLCIVNGGIETINEKAVEIRKNLVKSGLKVKVARTNDNNKLPFLLIFDPKHGIHSDLFFAYIDSNSLYLPMKNVKYEPVEVKKILPLSTYSIGEKVFNVPNDIQYFLRSRYGETWNVADEFFRSREK